MFNADERQPAAAWDSRFSQWSDVADGRRPELGLDSVCAASWANGSGQDGKSHNWASQSRKASRGKGNEKGNKRRGTKSSGGRARKVRKNRKLTEVKTLGAAAKNWVPHHGRPKGKRMFRKLCRSHGCPPLLAGKQPSHFARRIVPGTLQASSAKSRMTRMNKERRSEGSDSNKPPDGLHQRC